MKKKFLAAAALALGITATAAPAAQADGHLTLAEILLADGDEFDDNQNDFDIVTQALLATNELNGLASAALDPDAAITVFLPTDKAFRILVEDLLGVSIDDEEELFNAIVQTVTPEGVSDILLYHVLGFEADSSVVTSLESGAEVPTLLTVGEGDDATAATITVQFKGKKQIRLLDDGGPGRDPIVRAVDIEASNGVAHVIDRVLIPG